MRFVEKTPLRLKTRKKTAYFHSFAFDDFGGAGKEEGVLYGKGSNCEIIDGALCSGAGITALKSEGNKVYFSGSSSPVKSFFSIWGKDEDGKVFSAMAILTENGTFWANRENGAYWERVHSFGAKTVAFTAVDEGGELTTALVGYGGVAFYDEQKGLRFSGIQSARPVGCYCLGRVFVAREPFVLSFSSPFSPLDFTDGVDGGGTVKLPTDKGEIVALTTFKNKVYVFFERGIALLIPSGSAREFVVRQIEYQGSGILEGSVGVLDGGILFLSEEGAYRFDGERCVRICANLKIAPKRGGQVCNHAVFSGKYYVTYEDENAEKRGLVIDGESGGGYEAFAIEGLSEYEGKGVGVYDYVVQTVNVKEGSLPRLETRVFRVNGLDFKDRGLKSLQTLTFFGEGSAIVSVKSEREAKGFSINLSEVGASVRAFVHGRNFSLQIQLMDGAKLFAVTADYERVASLTGKEAGFGN